METLNNFGQTIAAFIFVLGVMIFIHELGHHLVAKWLGIRVETFSLGFGPRLFGFQMGGTDYRVSLLPLGGFVKMAGEHITEELTGAPDEFLSRPRWQRFLVALAGPVMNVGLAIVLLAGNYMVGVRVSAHLDQAPKIGFVAPDSPAQKAGILVGDTILSVDGEATPNWQDAEIQIAINAGGPLAMTLEREGQTIDKVVEAEVGAAGLGRIGVAFYLPFVAREVDERLPAFRAGLQPGDELVQARIGDESAAGYYEIRELILRHEGEDLHFTVRRGDQVLDMAIAPQPDQDPDGTVVARIGVFPDIPSVTQQYNLVGAFRRSVQQNVRLALLLFDILGRIITGETPVSQLSGPIEIARFSGAAASQGFTVLVGFMAFISLQLGILNLMPIPVLDGGAIAMLAVEGVMGRDLSLKAKERILQAGLFFLVLLMGFVILNDISKLL
ncbi:MAG: RIP metalloprotease RseP [Acidobacteriota bacterium]